MLRSLTLALLLVTCAIVTDARAGKVEFLSGKLDEAAAKGWTVEVHFGTVAAPTYGTVQEKVSEGVLTLVRPDKLGFVYIPIDEITALSIYGTAPEGFDPARSKKFEKPSGDKLAGVKSKDEMLKAEKLKSKLDSTEPQKKEPTKGEKGEPDKKGEKKIDEPKGEKKGEPEKKGDGAKKGEAEPVKKSEPAKPKG